MKTIKKLPFLLLSMSLLFSCKFFNKGYIRYGVEKPFVELEKTSSSEGELKNELPSFIYNKIQNDDTFMLYIHSTTCDHCTYNDEHFFNDYLKEHNVVVYGLLINEFYTNEEEYYIYQNDIKPLFNNKLEGTPFYGLFLLGEAISCEQDLDYFSLFFNTYIVTEN